MENMQTQVQSAVDQLRKSAKGRDAITHLSAWFDSSACSLDGMNQQAVYDLLDALWDGFAGTVRDCLRAPGLRIAP